MLDIVIYCHLADGKRPFNSGMYESQPMVRAVKLALVLALLYAVSGRAALLLALPPSYASAIFPPAGIALAFVLVYGWRVLPGVFLGSLLLNAWLELSRDGASSLNVVAPLLIAAGSTAQAVVGRLVFGRLLDGEERFDSAASVLLFVLIAPLVCLTSASLSLAGLFFIGVQSAASFGIDWSTWWLGDALGVVLVLPLTLLFIGRPRSLWRRRRMAVGFPVLVGVGLCVLVYVKAIGWEQSQSLREFQLASQRTTDVLQTHLANQELVVEELAAFMSHDGPGQSRVTRAEFDQFARATLAMTPEVAALEWVPCVPDAARPAFEEGVARSVPGFEITERASNGSLVRASRRAQYFPVTYVEPIVGNHAAVGFDLGSNALRREAIVRALKSGHAAASSPIELVQEQHKQKGLILVRAVHSDAECPDLVLSVLRLGDFVRKSLPSEAAVLDLHVDDLEGPVPVFGEPSPPGRAEPLTRKLQLGGRTYLLVAEPTSQYLAQHKSWQSLLLLAGCLFGTSLLGALILLSTGYAERTETVVRERTEQLERESEKTAMFLRNSSDGTHVIDAHGRLVEVSDSFCRMLGYTRADLLGKRISDWDADVRPEDVESIALARLNADHSSTFTARHRRKDGSTFDVEVCVSPINKPEGSYLFASSRDITQRKLVEQALHQSEKRLQSVTDRIPMAEQKRRQEQREFMAMISHEFRTPLSVIGASTDNLLISPHLDARDQARCHKILRANERLTVLMDNYLSAARLESAEAALTLACTDLRTVCALALNEFDGAPGPAVVAELPPQAIACHCDEGLIRIALRNLLSNARRHSLPDQPVTLRLVDRGAEVELSIHNTGAAIASDELPLIFNRYYRGRNARHEPGAGLGLHLVKSIVERHGGQLSVESSTEQGTDFRIVLKKLPARLHQPQ